MRNITVTLKEDLTRWLKVHAAKNGKSASKVIAELVAELKERESGYRRAMKQFFDSPPSKMREGSSALPSRDELYERR